VGTATGGRAGADAAGLGFLAGGAWRSGRWARTLGHGAG